MRKLWKKLMTWFRRPICKYCYQQMHRYQQGDGYVVWVCPGDFHKLQSVKNIKESS